jgi:hypothetical protein
MNVSTLVKIAGHADCAGCAIKLELRRLATEGAISRSRALATSPQVRNVYKHSCSTHATQGGN